ncbi:MAG: hypothetical protein GPOALKHO_000706 [Sodalis sp.]|nr:MAG: hypothetical protein GPOALKHO_000706 [Sodalis sp.]
MRHALMTRLIRTLLSSAAPEDAARHIAAAHRPPLHRKDVRCRYRQRHPCSAIQASCQRANDQSASAGLYAFAAACQQPAAIRLSVR